MAKPQTQKKRSPTPVDEALQILKTIGSKKRRWYSWGTTYDEYVQSLCTPHKNLINLQTDVGNYQASWPTTRFFIRVFGIGDIKRKQAALAYFRVENSLTQLQGTYGREDAGFATQLSEAIKEVKTYQKSVSWFSRMSGALTRVGGLLTRATSEMKVNAKTVPATSQQRAEEATEKLVTAAPSYSPPPNASAVEKEAPSSLSREIVVPPPPPIALHIPHVSASPNPTMGTKPKKNRKTRDAADAILPEVAAFIAEATSRDRLSNQDLGTFTAQFEKDKSLLNAAVGSIARCRQAVQQVQWNNIIKVIKNKLLVYYHPDRHQERERLEKSGEATCFFVEKLQTPLASLASSPQAYSQATEWEKSFNRSMEELWAEHRELWEMFREVSKHFNEIAEKRRKRDEETARIIASIKSLDENMDRNLKEAHKIAGRIDILLAQREERRRARQQASSPPPVTDQSNTDEHVSARVLPDKPSESLDAETATLSSGFGR